MFIFYNPNPEHQLVGDCVIRAVSKLTNQDWETTYLKICLQGALMHDMPSANRVWEAYLSKHGFIRTLLPDTCPDCYTVKDFCDDYSIGKYLLAIGTHVVAVEDGNYYDTWDSGNEIPMFYWRKEIKHGAK